MSLYSQLGALKAERDALVHQAYVIKRQIKAVKKRTNLQTTLFAIVGSILGLVLAISQVLEHHGPTVTLLGTLGAYILYGLSGFTGFLFFSFLGREGVEIELDQYREELEKIQLAIMEIDEEAESLRFFVEY